MNDKLIKFVNIAGVPEVYNPEPSIDNVPEWYRMMTSYSTGEKIPLEPGSTSATIKKCVPVFDMITAGYIIKTHCDIKVSWNGIVHEFMPAGNVQSISYHAGDQAAKHPDVINKLISIPKFINPWSIQTPKGYSCLFIPPTHRESPFDILPGIVDTDAYHHQVHLPFIMKDQQFEGIIKAGTPVAQIIPFKRDSWRSNIEKAPSGRSHIDHLNAIVSVFFDGYRSMFWKKKSYK